MTIHLSSRLLLAAAAIGLVAPIARAQEAATITGTVTSTTGKRYVIDGEPTGAEP